MKIKPKRLLWLDDERNPYTGSWLGTYTPEYETKNAVSWVKTYTEFTEWIQEHDMPDKIAFDHDLADLSENEKTGLDCAKWLCEYCMDNNKPLPSWVVQSANPVGAENINSYLLSYIKNVETN
jgi:hypothetical protein